MLDAISFTGIRGVDGIKEASVDLNGREVKIAVVNGLHCAKELLDRMKDRRSAL
ncbi:MAG: [Fe-Fe] hydrogenase large subunit C-terminal domain-containing protein [Mediterraneibacter gnavus]